MSYLKPAPFKIEQTHGGLNKDGSDILHSVQSTVYRYVGARGGKVLLRVDPAKIAQKVSENEKSFVIYEYKDTESVKIRLKNEKCFNYRLQTVSKRFFTTICRIALKISFL